MKAAQSVLIAARCEAFAAVDGAVGLGDEGYASRLAASGTGRLIHFARLAIGRPGFAGLAARLATSGLVLETLLRLELLLTGGEHELSASVTADQRLVLVHGKSSRDKNKMFWLCKPADLVFAPTLAA